MGGTTALMGIGLRAMVANYAALQTTGHNIANAGVDGYSRQTAEFSTATGQFTGAGFFGRGVDLDTVSRSHDQFLTREAASSKSVAAMDRARHESLQQLESVFPIGETGVGHAMGEFLNAMVDVASRPSDASARQVVLARAQDTAMRFSAASDQLDSVQDTISQRLADTISEVNSLAASIADVNQRIAKVEGLGQPANDMLDERDRLISELSEFVQVTTIPADDGTVGVFMGGGQRLVLGNRAASLSAISDPEDSSRTAVAIVESGYERNLSESTLGGGELAGLLRFQNDDLVTAQARLGQMAAAFSEAINNQQALGLDLNGQSGAPIFAVGAPLVQSNTENERDGSGNFAADVSLTIDDASALVASEYELRSDPAGAPGTWQLTRRSDGLVRSVVDGDTVDGFTLSLGSPAPATTDRFVLQPVSRAASGMSAVLGDPRGLAAASSMTATLAPSNVGTASVAALTVVDDAADTEQTAQIAFISDTGDYTWELRDRTSNALLSSGTGTWTAGEPIALNGFELQLDGVPRSGDSLSVAKTDYPGASNGNALALAALRDGALVGGETFTNAYASAMADLGVRVQGARVGSEVSASVAAQAEQARAAGSGVNLDEEAARLLAFQQSYQAAAKVLQVAQSVFDTLLDMART
jgi:flagellar hook-associated protein 1 FlgK